MSFPEGFLWGAATSAYQIEGSPLADGAGVSNWHRFAHTPGMVTDGDTGDIACDHYRRYESDVDLMATLGLNAYRFSVSWSRVLPEGTGAVNEKGLDFYSRLVDALLEKSITPNLTLYHWDLPAALDDKGGWLNRDIANWFADYANVIYDRLGDRVPMWATINEPWVIMDGGYLFGKLAPGHRSLYEAPIVSHNVLRAHGAAVQAFRASSASKNTIGLVVNIEPKYAASDSAEDLAATRRADAYMNRQYLEPVMLGTYPEEMAEIWGDAWQEWPAGDMRLISEKVDFVGINYYTRSVNRNDPECLPVLASGILQPDSIHTETGWEVFPDALTQLLVWANELCGGLPLTSPRTERRSMTLRRRSTELSKIR
jgi:beta-glucosidase